VGPVRAHFSASRGARIGARGVFVFAAIGVGAHAVGAVGGGQLASTADCARPASWRSGSRMFGVRADAYSASLILRERR